MISMEELKEKYDAVLVAVGIGRPQMLEMFEGNPYAVPAVTFLAEVDERQGEWSCRIMRWSSAAATRRWTHLQP